MKRSRLFILHLTLLAAASAAACSGFYIGKAATADGTHPNAAGYTVWADALLPYLKEFCGTR